MQISVQQYNAVVEGLNTQKQLLHDQVNEKIAAVALLQAQLNAVRETMTAVIAEKNRLVGDLDEAIGVVESATRFALDQACTIDVRESAFGYPLIEAIIGLRNQLVDAKAKAKVKRAK